MKRLLLSFFLTMNKPLWFFDEPLLGLDPFSSTLFFQLLLEHRRNGGIVFVISHTEILFSRSVSLLL
jgi:ABC-type transport system involved in cytochrome c biogenesis ATPase subunit